MDPPSTEDDEDLKASGRMLAAGYGSNRKEAMEALLRTIELQEGINYGLNTVAGPARKADWDAK